MPTQPLSDPGADGCLPDARNYTGNKPVPVAVIWIKSGTGEIALTQEDLAALQVVVNEAKQCLAHDGE